MQKFTASLNFEAIVSESAADDLEYLLNEFIQSVVNVVGNDEFDRIQEQIAGDSADQARAYVLDEFVTGEGSDAPSAGSDSL